MIFNCLVPDIRIHENEIEENQKYSNAKYRRLAKSTDLYIIRNDDSYLSDHEKNAVLGHSEKDSNPLSQFFQIKRHSLMRSFYDITALIDERKKLKEQNLYPIAQGECEVLTRMHRLDDWLEGINPGVDKRRSGLEKDLLDFGRQKRTEEVSAWKDVLMLKKDLRELLNDMYKEYTKQSLVYRVK